eukprot:Selendium_serpulae@DN5132_c0_g1_i1.p1
MTRAISSRTIASLWLVSPKIGLKTDRVQLRKPRPIVMREAQITAQSNRCAGCQSEFSENSSMFRLSSSSRKCWYSELYCCAKCHHGDERSIPARILHFWDFAGYPVSHEAAILLDRTYDKPIITFGAYIDIAAVAEDWEAMDMSESRSWCVAKTEEPIDKLFEAVPELGEVQHLRQLLMGLKATALLAKCAVAIEGIGRSLQTLEPHMRSNASVYSVHDLVHVFEQQQQHTAKRNLGSDFVINLGAAIADWSMPNLPAVLRQQPSKEIWARENDEQESLARKIDHSWSLKNQPVDETASNDAHHRRSSSAISHGQSQTSPGVIPTGTPNAETLPKKLRAIISTWLQHVEMCEQCLNLGQRCTTCQQGEPLFPYDFKNYQRCSRCRAVKHRRCAQLLSRCDNCNLLKDVY